MAIENFIPEKLVSQKIASVDDRISVLEAESKAIETEIARLKIEREALTFIVQLARPGGHGGIDIQTAGESRATRHIQDGRQATVAILELVRQNPGIKQADIVNAFADEVRPDIRRGPRRFLGDLLWELRHRKKLRRDDIGGFYVLQEGGEK